jgi:hypothetical protein
VCNGQKFVQDFFHLVGESLNVTVKWLVIIHHHSERFGTDYRNSGDCITTGVEPNISNATNPSYKSSQSSFCLLLPAIWVPNLSLRPNRRPESEIICSLCAPLTCAALPFKLQEYLELLHQQGQEAIRLTGTQIEAKRASQR